MKYLALCLGLMAGPVWAETALPALHDVAGVAANDVLNLRAEPDAGAAIVGVLSPDLQGIEVTGLSPDGKWGRVNQAEASGWAAMAFLTPQDNAPWYGLTRGLMCFGTEPFWTLFLDDTSAHYLTPDQEGPQMGIAARWPGEDWRQVAAVQIGSATGSSLAVIRGEACSDGMSDATFGLAVDIFSQGETAAPAASLRGCCRLVP